MLPVVSGKQARKAFEKAGWSFIRQRGSHMILSRDGVGGNLSVPDHTELDRGTLRHLIKAAGITVDEFIALLK